MFIAATAIDHIGKVTWVYDNLNQNFWGIYYLNYLTQLKRDSKSLFVEKRSHLLRCPSVVIQLFVIFPCTCRLTIVNKMCYYNFLTDRYAWATCACGQKLLKRSEHGNEVGDNPIKLRLEYYKHHCIITCSWEIYKMAGYVILLQVYAIRRLIMFLKLSRLVTGFVSRVPRATRHFAV